MNNNKLSTKLARRLEFLSSLNVASNLGLNRELPAGLWDPIGWIGPAPLGQLPCFKDGVRGAFLFQTPPNQKFLPSNVTWALFALHTKWTVWSPPKANDTMGEYVFPERPITFLQCQIAFIIFHFRAWKPCRTCRMSTGTWASIDLCASSSELQMNSKIQLRPVAGNYSHCRKLIPKLLVL